MWVRRGGSLEIEDPKVSWRREGGDPKLGRNRKQK